MIYKVIIIQYNLSIRKRLHYFTIFIKVEINFSHIALREASIMTTLADCFHVYRPRTPLTVRLRRVREFV